MKRFLKKKTDISQMLAKTAVALCVITSLTGCGTKSEDKTMEQAACLVANSYADFVIKSPVSILENVQNNVEAMKKKEEPPETDNTLPSSDLENMENPVPNEEDLQEGTLYERFLRGEAAATVREDYMPDPSTDFPLEKGKSYTLRELGQQVNDTYLDPEHMPDTGKTSYDEIQYTYVRCLDSDKKNLLVKFEGLDIYCENDYSYTVMAITEDNGQIYITYQYDCWPRSNTYEYTKGQIASFGSSGAGDHHSDLSVLLSNGKCVQIYDIESLNDEWISYVNDEIYSEVFGENPDLASYADWAMYITTIGNEKYYQYDIDECSQEEKELCQKYIDRCREEASINWTTDEVILEAIENRCANLGFNYEETKDFVETEWTTL